MIFNKADILVPKEQYLSDWCVVACDQYTSQPEYWSQVEKRTAHKPSALDLILPEIYLDHMTDNMIKKIHENMRSYDQCFDEHKESVIYIRRVLSNGNVREGLIGVVDLEAYDYNAGSQSPIRATEGTVLERIPPRAMVRRNASLELPHIMLLINDPHQQLIESCAQRGEKIYDTILHESGGSVQGYLLSGEFLEKLLSNIHDYANNSALPFAVGDGNHSLATAKAIYEENKITRYALVELVNIHSPALHFEPIHRILFNADLTQLMAVVKTQTGECKHTIECVYSKGSENIPLNSHNSLAVGALQEALDEYLADNPQVKIDYVHGEDVVKNLCSKPGNLGFILPNLEKSSLFDGVSKNGALPRKTFSMGEANDKRYYLEARRINNG